MNDPRVSRLVSIFEDKLRKDDGLTTAKMLDQPALRELLVDDGTAEEAKAALVEIVLGMGDGPRVRAVRNSLVISNGRDGIEARSGPEERRRWATGHDDVAKGVERFISRNIRTHHTYETKGFEELARLILDRAGQRGNAGDKGDLLEISRDGDAGLAEPKARSLRLFDVIRADYRRWSMQELTPVRAQLLAIKMVVAFVVILGPMTIVAVASQPEPTIINAVEPAGGLTKLSPPLNVALPADAGIDSANGWGPDRPVYSRYHPPVKPVLNSVIDDFPHGDERNFVQCHNMTASFDQLGGDWSDSLGAYDGDVYECVVYFNNSIDPDLDSDEAIREAGSLASKLKNVRARVEFTHKSGPASASVVGVLSADNSVTVWDSCVFTSERPVTLVYRLGTARIALYRDVEARSITDDVVLARNGVVLDQEMYGYLGHGGGHLYFELQVKLG